MSGGATSPTDYVIRTRFDVGAVPGLGAVTTQIGRLDQRISGLGNTLTNKLVAGFAAVASAQGLKSLVSQVVGLNVELQNAEFGIGTLLSALGKMPFDSALGLARSQVQGLREDAAKGIGELSDYMRGFQILLGPVSQGGASLAQIRELNRLAIAAGGAMQGQRGMREAPLDIVQAIRGGLSEKMTPYAVLAAQSIGVSMGEFKAMDTAKRVETLIKAFKSFEGASKAYGRTWDAQFSTFKDGLKDLARTVTAPLFESWTKALTEANSWLQKNKALIDDIARQVGQSALSGQGALVSRAGAIGSTGAAGLAGAVGVRGAVGLAGMLGVTGGWGAVIAGIVGAALAPITLAISSAIQRWPKLGRMMAGELGGLGKALVGFGSAVLRLTENPVVQGFGVFFAEFAMTFVRGLTGIVNAATWMLDKLNYWHSMGFLSLFEGIASASGNTALAGVLGRERVAFANQSNPNSIAGYLPKDPAEYLPKRQRHYGEVVGEHLANREFTPPPVVKIDKVEVKVEAERLDDPNTVARTFEAAMAKVLAHPKSVRAGRLVPKPL